MAQVAPCRKAGAYFLQVNLMTHGSDVKIDCKRRRELLKATNAAFAALRNDPDAWDEEILERQSWNATIADGQNEKSGKPKRSRGV